MRRLPYKLVAGSMVATILILTFVAAGLALAIFDEEVASRHTETPWLTEVIEQQPIPTFWRSETPTDAQITSTPSTPSSLPTSLPSDQQVLPSQHPTFAPDAPCLDCHQVIHEGGG